MAQINFPEALANGQTFEAPNGVIYTYVGVPPNGYWSGTFQDQGLQTLDDRYLKLDASNDPITSSLEVQGDITVSGTVDGRDVAADGAKLDGIESGADISQWVDVSGGINYPDGNVGIGTNSPSAKLQVQAANNDNPASSFAIRQNNTADTSQTTFSIETSPNEGVSRLISTATSTPQLAFFTGQNEAVRIDASGEVGIGRENPIFKLDVAGDIRIKRSSTSDGALYFGVTGSENNYIYGNSDSNVIAFGTKGAEIARLTDEELLLGTDASRNNLVNGALSARFQIEGTNHSASSLSVIRNSNDDNNAFITIGKTRSTGVKGNAAVLNDDLLGTLSWLGSDGTSMLQAAYISGGVDGTPGTGDMPGRLMFSTFGSPDGKYHERLRIDSSGYIGVNNKFPSFHVDIKTEEGVRLFTPNTNDISRKIYFGGDNSANQIKNAIIVEPVGTWGRAKFHICSNNDSDASNVTIDDADFTVTPDGKVGIGNVNPLTTLHVEGEDVLRAGASTTSTDAVLRGYNEGDPHFVLEAHQGDDHTKKLPLLLNRYGGPVGVGLENPAGVLGVQVAGSPVVKDVSIGYDNSPMITYRNGTGSWFHFGKHPTDDALIFSVGANTTNNEIARFDASKNFLLGAKGARNTFLNQSFGAALQVEGADHNKSSAALIRNSDDQGGPYLNFAKTRSEDISGNALVVNDDVLGVIAFQGNTGTKFVEAAAISARTDSSTSSTSMPGRLSFAVTPGNDVVPKERMRIKSNGNVCFNYFGDNLPGSGNTETGAVIERVSNGSTLFVSRADNIVARFNRNNDGDIVDLRRSGNSVGTISVTTTGTAYNETSDYRLKENIVDIVDAIDRVKQLKPRRYNFKIKPELTVDGFIAHEAQEVVPEAVTGKKDQVSRGRVPIYQGIDKSKLVPLLTAALQETIAKVEALEQRLADAGIE